MIRLVTKHRSLPHEVMMKAVQGRNKVYRDGDYMVKHLTQGAAQVQVMQKAHALSVQTGKFYAPAVLDYDEKNSLVKLEYIPGLKSLKEYISGHTGVGRLLFFAGDALAACHHRIRLDPNLRVEAPDPWRGSDPDRIVVHGDFNLINVCYCSPRDQLIFLDWESSPGLPFPCNYASRYLDIAQFVRCLLLQQKSFVRAWKHFQQWVQLFLKGYEQYLHTQLDIDELRCRVLDYNRALMKKQWAHHQYRSYFQSVVMNNRLITCLQQEVIRGMSATPGKHMNKRIDYRASHTDPEKGRVYDKRFQTFAWRRHLWQREQKILQEILDEYYCGDEIHYLDFACGTGRILEFMKDSVSQAVGVDVSESMLAECTRKNPEVAVYHADLTRNPVLGNRIFNLITAFRFFPNAQENLRKEALAALSRHLSDEGLLVFNNHQNHSSVLYRLARLLGRSPSTMSHKQVHSLLQSSGFEICRVYSLGASPVHDRAKLWVPSWVHDGVDWIVHRFGCGESLCQNIIYVCRKQSSDASLQIENFDQMAVMAGSAMR